LSGQVIYHAAELSSEFPNNNIIKFFGLPTFSIKAYSLTHSERSNTVTEHVLEQFYEYNKFPFPSMYDVNIACKDALLIMVERKLTYQF
jgi:hypothetical protein